MNQRSRHAAYDETIRLASTREVNQSSYAAHIRVARLGVRFKQVLIANVRAASDKSISRSSYSMLAYPKSNLRRKQKGVSD
jgi:hypothetical protein